ncbi:MAG: dTDP-4-amino-4,6-dideoxygalactose transaminase [Flavobacteriales bacterium]|nr:dTDP-4-amino-4,6-dideoxygalactose transaminase [Flavobacteriales bacterium]
MIRFNKPYLFGPELQNVNQAVTQGRLAGNGQFTKQCHKFFEDRYGFSKVLLTTSCTDALEMSSLLLNIGPGDEIIIPSFTFVSTANAFVLRGAKIVFADSNESHPNISVDSIRRCITAQTKAIVVVHYGGAACDMNSIMDLVKEHDLFLIEDAAQAIESFYKGKPLGSFGHCATFSFHETKNVVAGEGGLLVVNDTSLQKRSEILWEKGTNRTAFFRGEIDKYGWVDLGSSFLPSELIAAYLFGQLSHIDEIQSGRIKIWNAYFKKLSKLSEAGYFELPRIPEYATNNGHVFFIVLKSKQERDALLNHLKTLEIGAVFHYLSLHKSEYYKDKHEGSDLPNSDRFSECLLRLPLHLHLSNTDIDFICKSIEDYYSNS